MLETLMPEEAKRVTVVFYRSPLGSEPVREWLLTLTPEERRVIGADIKTVEFGRPIGMPMCRSLDKGLWEVRSNLPGGRIARVVFCLRDGDMYLLNGFIKQTQRTPPGELALARRRQQEVMR